MEKGKSMVFVLFLMSLALGLITCGGSGGGGGGGGTPPPPILRIRVVQPRLPLMPPILKISPPELTRAGQSAPQ